MCILLQAYAVDKKRNNGATEDEETITPAPRFVPGSVDDIINDSLKTGDLVFFRK